MKTSQGDPASSVTAVAADRRRGDRLGSVSPELIPLLRGKVDPDAPADPVLPRPGGAALDRDLLSGAAITLALVLVGTLLRYAV